MAPAPEELHSIIQILHLAHHRNKNQHRLAKWYKAFNLLRRNISKLSTELDTSIQYTALSAKARRTVEAREIVESRLAFLQDVLVERCYLAFSQLVADNQYSALGLMLLAVLARVKRVTKPLMRESEDVEEAGKARGESHQDFDVGEVVQRKDVVEEAGTNKKNQDKASETLLQKKKKKKRLVEGSEVSNVESPLTKRARKKPKKGDAFDDLFAGLV